MDTSDYEIILPEIGEQLDQNEEWFMVKHEGQVKKVRSHDYDEIYRIPGLYEDIFYKRLGCVSPKVVCELLNEEIKKKGEQDSALRVFDFGAGNGMVGEIVRKMGCDFLVGVDILPEAKEAAERDRPGVYDDYYVLDMTCLEDEEKRKFEEYNFNTLVTVAALGFDDIPTRAFMNAFNLLKNDAWVAFNIKEKFLSKADSSGYGDVIGKIMDDNLVILQERKYCHRLSVAGEELCYHAIVGKKANNIDDISGIIRAAG
ncbi:methyltransferase [Desulfobacterales bacterium HSG2]|nr:methyltransferase [Desulfobacterales bacterium HSG2]